MNFINSFHFIKKIEEGEKQENAHQSSISGQELMKKMEFLFFFATHVTKNGTSPVPKIVSAMESDGIIPFRMKFYSSPRVILGFSFNKTAMMEEIVLICHWLVTNTYLHYLSGFFFFEKEEISWWLIIY